MRTKQEILDSFNTDAGMFNSVEILKNQKILLELLLDIREKVYK